MIKRMFAAPASVLVLMLAGCGGGGSSGPVNSTPTPPGASYTKVADMTGNRTYQTAGVQYNVNTAAPGISGGVGQNFGSGVTVAYTETAGTYQLTAPDGTTVTVGLPDRQPGSTDTNATYQKTTGTTQDRINLVIPTSSSITLSYMVVGTWGRVDTATGLGVTRIAVGGSPTLASDVPRTGSANYTIGIGGSAALNGVIHNLPGNSTGTFSANFGSNTVQTTLNLGGTPIGGGAVQSFGAFSGSGTISSSGPGFSGTLTGTLANGLYSGAFFGPQAAEVGFGYYLNGATFSASGAVLGAKQ
jgi:hypothetical protein